MKTKVKRMSKRTLAVFLGVLMLVTSIGMSSLISTTAATTWTFYVAIKDPANYYSGSTVRCTVNFKGDGNDWHDYDMTAQNTYWAGRSLYKCSFTDLYGGLGALQFKVLDGSTQKEFWRVFGDKDWHSTSSSYSNHVFVFDTQDYTDTYSTSNAKYGWSKGDYYLYNNITDSWYGGNSAPKMTVDSSDSSRRYYDLYLKQNEKTSSDYLLFRFWDNSDSEQIGPSWSNDHRSSISGKTASSPATNLNNITNWGDKDTAWQYPTNGFTSGKYYRVRVYIDTDYNGTGGVWATNTALTNMDPTFSTTSFVRNSTYDLTSIANVTSGSNVGTVTYTSYQYYDGSWHNISTPSSWTPTSTSITKLKVTATDGGVKSTGNNDTRNAYSARTETKETTVSVTATSRTITYTGSNCTFGGSKPATAYSGDTVSFTAAANAGYRITGVKYNDGSDHTLTASNGTYSFTMPDTNVTVTATTVKTYSVTLSTSATGFATKKYKVGSGTQYTYSSAITVDTGSSVTFDVTYTSGYEYDSTNSTLSGATASNSNKTFTLSSVTADTTVTLAAKKTGYSGLSAVGKYSTTAANDASYSNDFPSGSTPNVTIAATSATVLDGVAVTAPGTDPTGYVFAGWYTANGSFANAANKDTTFYPNAANAVAIAKYKKIFTITSSVDNTGTGAGTVTTSKSTVEAGGSYTITSTAKSNSAIQSITVNGTGKGTDASTTVSSVSADQTVVVKFKSTIDLKGSFDSWGTGQNMVSNSAGTSFSTTVTVNANTATEFKLMKNSTWAASGVDTVDTWELNGIASHTTSGNNLKITPTVKAKITFISNGSKFTSITAVPYDSTTYNVTLKKVEGSTITATYMGTEYTTASADAIVPVYSGTEINFTVTAASGKYLSGLTTSAGTLSPAFAVGDSYTGKITGVNSARTITPTVANKLTVTAKTNKSARGTVSVSPTNAIPGQTVTITCTPKSGILTELVVTNASTNAVVKRWTRNSSGDMKVAAAAKKSYKKSKDVLLTGADDPLTFEMPSAAVTVTATYGVYSAESNWYYNGYDTSANKVAAYHSKQMTEGMVGGEKFSYYHVEGRTGSDHLFTVSDGMVVDTRYVYFTRPKNYSYWSTSNSPKAHFWKNGGSDYDTWPGNTMTWVYDNDMGEAVFKIAIPVGADRVSFNDASNNGQQQTVDIDLTNTSGAYYVSGWNEGAQKYDYGTWNTGNSDQGYVESGTEYFYNKSIYTADFSTNGFNNHYTNSKDFSKPKNLYPYTGDYYVNVLYPGKTYTINGVTKTVGNSNPLVIWTSEPLNDDGDTVTVYAKDGSIRSEAFGSTYANIADTQIVASASGTTSIGTSHNGNISGQTYETYKAGKGETIYIRTTINTTAGNGVDTTTNRNKYYVRGFCINGEVSQLLEWNSNGVYTTSYKIPEDYEGKYVEITPIYYLKDTQAHPIVTYRVTGFTDKLKEVGSGKPGWGDTLYTYPFYGKLGSNNNALGAYPGQPMVYYKGQYQMQIPEQSTAWDIYLSDSNLSGTDAQKKTQVSNTNVSGVTMSNGYYDIVHRQIMGYGGNGASADHVQTYDYGDFYKIFNEKAPVDNIVFDFKYKTTKHNFETSAPGSPTPSNLTSTYTNGFELLTNFHGRHVDLFGTPLSGDAADPSKTKPLYVVSIGGVNGSAGVENIAGYYATEWKIFVPTTPTGTPSSSDAYTLKSANGKNSIPPEVLILNDDDNTSFNTTTYPSADANHTVNDWKALYTALEAYRGKPVMISYEAADAQIGAGNYATSGGGGATRNDGRWLYSKNGETITSKIRVDVSEDNGLTYTDNSTLNTPVSDLDAYFTNAEVEGETTYTTTIDPDKTFDMEAHSNNADYKFMGWYMDDGTKITTDNVTQTERSGSYTFVARFMHFTGGQLILGHKAVKGTAANSTNYNGSGNATIAVTVKNGDEIVREIAASSSDITLDDKIINNENSGYTIEVTLNASGTGEDTYARTECSAANTFFGGQSAYTTMPQTFTFTVGSLFSNNTQATKKITYSSYFNEVKYSYKYTFNFPDRAGNTKSYVREGALTAAQRETYVTGSGNESRVLSQEFMNRIAPHESNFNQTLKWNITASDRTFTKSGNNYTLTKSLTAEVDDSKGARSTKRTATFSLPYAHTNGVPTSTQIVDKATATDFVINDLEYGSLVKTGAGEDDYVVAPRQLRENESGQVITKNFQYWSMASTKNPGVEVARCYFYSFNFVAYDSYIITPVYDTAVSPLNSGSGSDVLTTISFLETSRNQFNGTGAASNDLNTAADILYNDFVLSYNYNGLDLYKNDSSSSAVSKIGYVVERVQKLEVQQDGTPYTDPSHYSDVTVKTENEIKNFINGTATSGLTKYELNKSDLDNKNRIEFYEAYYNSRNWDKDSQKFTSKSAYKNYVYKAYTYMIVDGEVYLSDPAYFTMYDEATK